MHAHDAACFKFWCFCGVGGVLDFVTICRCEPFEGRILGEFRDTVLEALQVFGDVVGHGDVNIVFWVVPIDGQSGVLANRWVNGDRIMLLECIDEVVGIVGGK